MGKPMMSEAKNLFATPSSQRSASSDRCTPSEPSTDRDVYLRIRSTDENSELDFVQRDSTTLDFSENGTFNFTKIFDEDSTQTEVFNNSVHKRVVDFINGKSSTVLTYGVSGTGKTYTMYGTVYEPGVVPHAIRSLFSTVRCTPEPWYKVTGDDLIVALNKEERVMEEIFKRQKLDSYKSEASNYVRERLLSKCNSQIFKSNQEYSADTSMTSVWISVMSIEIDSVYDILDDESGSLTLSFCKDGAAYVPGLKFIHITTEAEAHELLISKCLMPENGKYVKQNVVLTIKLLRYQKENAANTVSVSTLTFCDIVDDEIFKYNPTVEEEERWRNMCNNICILETYIKTVYKGGDKAFWLFWESALTLLLRRPLSGQEAMTFLVTVDYDSDSVLTKKILQISSMMKGCSTSASIQSSGGVESEAKH